MTIEGPIIILTRAGEGTDAGKSANQEHLRAAISMTQRFNVPLNDAVRWLDNDCNRLVRLAAQGHLLLRYEDRFFDAVTRR